jgi:uncharacterized protein YutE (UPF0331/DUF86 family)
VVDDVRVARLIRSLADDLSVLKAEASAPALRRADPMWLRGVKYAFVTGIEALVDVAQHVCASEGWGPPQDNGDAVRLLGAHGVLDAQLAEGLRRAVGFRNVLVHEYVRVDDDVVLARLADLSELEEFVGQVGRWLRTV